MRVPFALALVLLSLAGCNGGDGGPGGDGDDTGSPTPPSGLEGEGEAPDATEGFAVLVVEGRLEGEGPAPGSVAACSIAPPDGHIDVDGKQVWARPDQHSFKVGRTWLLVLDRVEVEDPRRSGCTVQTLTPFTAEGNWHPQLEDATFGLDVTADAERLMVSRNALEPGGRFETYVEFEDGDYTFTGDLEFTHAGWWPPESFAERDEEVPMDEGAVWWVDPER